MTNEHLQKCTDYLYDLMTLIFDRNGYDYEGFDQETQEFLKEIDEYLCGEPSLPPLE